MKKKLAILLFFIVSISMGYGQYTMNKNLLLERVKSYYKAKQFANALNEVQKILTFAPEDIEARIWQTTILLNRNKFPQGTQFDLILENVSFLRSVAQKNPAYRQKVQPILKQYNREFADLIIRIPNAPAIGFYVAHIPILLKPPIKLSPIQQARLNELNAYFQSDGRLYFNYFLPKQKEYACIIQGFPVIPVRRKTVKYTAIILTNLDTLRFAFNLKRRNPLILTPKHPDNVYYQLPPHYTVWFADKNLSIERAVGNSPILEKKMGKYWIYLIPTQSVTHIRIGKKADWQSLLMLWGGLLAASFISWQVFR